MIEKEISGFEQKEPFSRQACVRHTAQTFSPLILSLGNNIEKRYLGGDVNVRPGESFLTGVSSLDLSVAQRLSQFRDPGVELTDEKLREFSEEREQITKTWGPTVVNHARKYGLVETLTPEETNNRLSLDHNLGLVEKTDNVYSRLSYAGWEIFPTKESDPMLVVPVQAAFETVRLDKLHEQDPEFLPQ